MCATISHCRALKLLGYAAVAALLALAPTAASAGKFKVLYSQCVEQPTCPDGTGGSTGPLVRDAAGNFYGTTPDGKAFVLKRKDTGKYKYNAIWNFKGGAPSGGMIIDTQGNLYGWASQFYKMTYGHGNHHNKWEAAFPTLNCSTPPCTGTYPAGTLTYAGAASGAPWDGTSPLYGVMSQGGANNAGTVYQLTPDGNGWSYTEFYSFCAQQNCTDGSTPVGGVLLDSSGVLYGTTAAGGCLSGCDINGGAGVIFELAPSGGSWTETVLHAFCSLAACADGAFPTANMAEDAAGDLVGVTYAGGVQRGNGGGVLFELTPNGAESQETVLYAFCQRKDCKDGATPVGTPLLDAAGDIFGTTQYGGGNDIDRGGAGGGIAYKLSGSTLQVLHTFCAEANPNCADGEYPGVGLTADGTGHLYGTANLGGAFDEGVIFELTP